MHNYVWRSIQRAFLAHVFLLPPRRAKYVCTKKLKDCRVSANGVPTVFFMLLRGAVNLWEQRKAQYLQALSGEEAHSASYHAFAETMHAIVFEETGYIREVLYDDEKVTNALQEFLTWQPVYTKSFRIGATKALDRDATALCKRLLPQIADLTKDPAHVSRAVTALDVLHGVMKLVPAASTLLAAELSQNIMDMLSSVRESTRQNSLTAVLTQFLNNPETAARGKLIVDVKSAYDESRTGHTAEMLDLLGRSRIVVWQFLQKATQCGMHDGAGVALELLKSISGDTAVIDRLGGAEASADLGSALSLVCDIRTAEDLLAKVGGTGNPKADMLQKALVIVESLEAKSKAPHAFHVSDFKASYDELRTHANSIVETARTFVTTPLSAQAKKLLADLEKKGKALQTHSHGDAGGKMWHAGFAPGGSVKLTDFLEERFKKLGEPAVKKDTTPINQVCDDKLTG